MTSNLFRSAVPLALAWIILTASINGAGAGAFTRGCAARDWQVLILIEDREATHFISSEQASTAMLTMMHARIVCHEGHVRDALAIYDDIVESLTAALSTYDMGARSPAMPPGGEAHQW